METRSLYVHIPFCESICSYCDFCKVYYDQKQSDLYLQRLNEELSQIEQHHLKTIYIGGGTPSALNDEQLEKLMSMLKPYSLEVEEYCMEVNPESMDYYKLKILKKGGINRLSIGVQTFQDHLLKEIDRHHNTTQVKNIIKYAKEIGFDNISIDLMYGLPKQTKPRETPPRLNSPREMPPRAKSPTATLPTAKIPLATPKPRSPRRTWTRGRPNRVRWLLYS